MDERAAFEKWLLDTHGLDDEWDAARNCYKRFEAHLAWTAWRTAHNKGFAIGSGNEGQYQRTISALRSALERAAGVIWDCRWFKLAGRERAYVYEAKRCYEALGRVPDEVVRATTDDDESPHSAEGNDR